MNLNSIVTKIIFLFILSLGVFFSLFIAYYFYGENQKVENIGLGYRDIRVYIHENRLRRAALKDYVESFHFQEIQEKDKILSEGKLLYVGSGFECILYKESYYLVILDRKGATLFKDLKEYESEYIGYFLLGSLLVLFVFMFLWIIRSLQPLQNLKGEVEKFAKGDLNISCKSESRDEIGELSNEFDNAVKKIKLLLESRQLFLRTVMHELKTPIGKGRIVSELIDDQKQRERMANVFDKLNYLINDFAKVEEILSESYAIHKYHYSLNTVIENAIEMMMLEKLEDNITLELSLNQKLTIDIELFSMSVKNLIDNALKYSLDKKITIVEREKEILFISLGEKLPKDLQEYFRAFHNDTKSKNHGMGLGLYIVNSILKLHNMTLDYEYSNNKNIFKILL